ncbi:MAG TPA: aconitate hydratase AcnA, partial [Anaerolineaceae bacterium]|nr:aconitate hydratase AcnA [Anaerolineaceae bacterium]
QDRTTLRQLKSQFHQVLGLPKSEGGYAISPDNLNRKVTVKMKDAEAEIGHGAVVIAAITSCTNTSNPFVMVSAGLLAKKAIEKGLEVKPYVKTSMAPGSRVVSDYLEQAGLMEPLEKLGFGLVGYGCTTCIGNSGPLPEEVAKAITGSNLVATAVLSGNRNFEGRINPYTLANYLASPPLVVAYALAGSVDVDMLNDPLGMGKDGQPVYLRDIWPSNREIADTINRCIKPEMFKSNYASVFNGNETWNKIQSGNEKIYPWDDESSYIQNPPYFVDLTPQPPKVSDIMAARALAVFGDSITTDHISPAGAIPANGAAGKYLLEHGIQIADFNSFGSRRGNDRVMTRGTFGNIRLKNLLVPGIEGSYTLHLPDKTQMSIYDAAMHYKAEGVQLIVLAGKEYGTGSSRDWAAKGTILLGVKAVIAESFERIHRSNLVGMGVLPLQFMPGENASSLGLSGHELFYFENLLAYLERGSLLPVQAVREDGSKIHFKTIVLLNTANEVVYYRNGGILNTVLYNMI